MKALALLAATLLLSGCANFGPTKYLAPDMGESAAGKHEVSVERDTNFGKNSIPAIIVVDGQAAAQVLGGEVITLHLADGRHAIGIQRMHEDKPDMAVIVDVGPDNKPVLKASLCAMGYCGFKLVRE